MSLEAELSVHALVAKRALKILVIVLDVGHFKLNILCLVAKFRLF